MILNQVLEKKITFKIFTVWNVVQKYKNDLKYKYILSVCAHVRISFQI